MFGLPVDLRGNSVGILVFFLYGLLASIVLGLDISRLSSVPKKCYNYQGAKGKGREDSHQEGEDSEDDEDWADLKCLEDELDTSDADVLKTLHSLRSMRVSKVEMSKQAEASSKKEALDAEEKKKAEIRKQAALQSEKLLEGDVVSAKDEKTVVREILFSLRGKKKEEESHGTDEHDNGIFEEVIRKFEVVELRGPNNLIEIHTFSNAVLELTKALDAFGSWMPVHSFVRNDIINNVRKVNLGCKRVEVSTLQEMVNCELDEDMDYFESGREALLWLKRTLQFIRRMLLYCVKCPDKPLADGVQRAYREALAPCHNWAVRPIFGLCLRAMPNRETFLKRLGPTEQDTVQGIKMFLDHFNPIVSAIVTFFNESKLEDRVRLEI